MSDISDQVNEKGSAIIKRAQARVNGWGLSINVNEAKELVENLRLEYRSLVGSKKHPIGSSGTPLTDADDYVQLVLSEGSCNYYDAQSHVKAMKGQRNGNLMPKDSFLNYGESSPAFEKALGF